LILSITADFGNSEVFQKLIHKAQQILIMISEIREPQIINRTQSNLPLFADILQAGSYIFSLLHSIDNTPWTNNKVLPS
jgi:hypothetical protein